LVLEAGDALDEAARVLPLPPERRMGDDRRDVQRLRDLDRALDLHPGVATPQPLQEEQRRRVEGEDRQVVAAGVLGQQVRVLAVARIGDHHLHAVVADLGGEAERLLHPRGEHGGGGQAHGDAAARRLLAARIPGGETTGQRLARPALRAVGAGERLAAPVRGRVLRLAVAAWTHGTSWAVSRGKYAPSRAP